jgi:hypothetical protein
MTASMNSHPKKRQLIAQSRKVRKEKQELPPAMNLKFKPGETAVLTKKNGPRSSSFWKRVEAKYPECTRSPDYFLYHWDVSLTTSAWDVRRPSRTSCSGRSFKRSSTCCFAIVTWNSSLRSAWLPAAGCMGRVLRNGSSWRRSREIFCLA